MQHLKKICHLILTGHGGWIFYRLRRYLRGMFGGSQRHSFVLTADASGQWLSQQQIQESMSQFNQSFRACSTTALCVHLYYSDILSEILSSPVVQSKPVDLHISLGPQVDGDFFKNLAPFKGRVFVYQFRNKGRDVYPFLKVYPELLKCNYKWVCKLHSKRSPQIRDGELWRKDLFADLLSLKMFHSLESAGSSTAMLAPRYSLLPVLPFLGTNGTRMQTLLAQMDLAPMELARRSSDSLFVAGTMFWFRPESLRPLLNLKSVEDLFEEETPTIDGLTAHAFERLFYFISHKSHSKLY